MNDDSTNLRQEFVTELESILESDEAYGSNLQILTYALKEDVINGKFKDSWNNRVYEFIIDIDGISYKPAAKLDSFGADELPIRFDAYSKGYASLFENERLDRNLTGKRVKKPKCGNQGYGCGYSCISLLKTCQILSSGKKAGTNQGKAIGQQRLNKLMELSKKLYLAGDTKKAALAGVIAANISKVRTKYNAGGQGLIAERALAKQQVVVKKPEPIKSVTAAKLSPKSQEKKSTKLTSDPTTNPKTHSIKNQKEFEDVMLHVFDKLNTEKNYDNFVPIAEIRKTIGELVPRDKFNDYMMQVQGDDKIQLVGGGQVTENDIEISIAGYRQYVQLLPTGKKILAKNSDTKKLSLDKKLQNRPDLDSLGLARPYAKGKAITSKADFDEVMINVQKALDKSFILGNLVPIETVRDVLKNRISEKDFNKFLTDGSPKQEFTLQSAGGYYENKYKGVKNFIGEEKHYIQLKE